MSYGGALRSHEGKLFPPVLKLLDADPRTDLIEWTHENQQKDTSALNRDLGEKNKRKQRCQSSKPSNHTFFNRCQRKRTHGEIRRQSFSAARRDLPAEAPDLTGNVVDRDTSREPRNAKTCGLSAPALPGEEAPRETFRPPSPPRPVPARSSEAPLTTPSRREAGPPAAVEAHPPRAGSPRRQRQEPYPGVDVSQELLPPDPGQPRHRHRRLLPPLHRRRRRRAAEPRPSPAAPPRKEELAQKRSPPPPARRGPGKRRIPPFSGRRVPR